jgi:hypothetical protein
LVPSDVQLLQSLLADSGFSVWRPTERDGLLAEDEARLVWVSLFASATELLESWSQEQTWFVNYVGNRVSFEKSWELYLVLATQFRPNVDDLTSLQEVRADTTFARKVVIPGLLDMSPARVRDYLAVLRPLKLDVSMGSPDPFRILEDAAQQEGRTDVLSTLERYRANQALFGADL